MTIRPTEHEHHLALFGTDVRLLISTPPRSAVATGVIIARVRARLESIHRTLTRFDPESELSQLNRHAGEWVPVSETMLEGLRAALFAAELSGGLVDPTLLHGLERAGYTESLLGRAPAPLWLAVAAAPTRAPAHPRPAAEWRRIQIDGERRAVRLPRGVRLDLGGSAKGMAVDVAAGMLSRLPAFAVDAGGDLRLGGIDGAPREVEITHPLDDRTVHQFMLSAGAVATSGLRTRVWAGGRGFAHHLIDPSTMAPAWTGVVQATAMAPSTLEAETLAKVALLRGPLAGRTALERFGGALILDSGELIVVRASTAESGRGSSETGVLASERRTA
jgi:thiamine biosynthesis lipoprotein